MILIIVEKESLGYNFCVTTTT